MREVEDENCRLFCVELIKMSVHVLIIVVEMSAHVLIVAIEMFVHC